MSDEEWTLAMRTILLKKYSLDELKTLFREDRNQFIDAYLNGNKLYYFTVEKARKRLCPEMVYYLTKWEKEGSIGYLSESEVKKITKDTMREYICRLIENGKIFEALPFDLYIRFKSRGEFISDILKECLKLKNYDVLHGIDVENVKKTEEGRVVVEFAERFRSKK